MREKSFIRGKQTMVIATLRISPPLATKEEVRETLRSLLGPTRVQKGCRRCELFQDIEDSASLILIQEWDCINDFEQHIGSDDYRRVLAVMDMSDEKPELKISTISGTAGLDLVESIRLSGC